MFGDSATDFLERYQAGRVIFQEGDDPDHFYVIKEGKVEIRKEAGEKSSRLAILDAGELFGEQAFIDPDASRSASALTREDSRIWKFPGDRFETCFEQNKDFRQLVIQLLSNRLRDTSKKAAQSQAEGDLLYRAVFLLIHLMEKQYWYGNGKHRVMISTDTSTISRNFGIPEHRLEQILENPEISQLEELRNEQEQNLRESAKNLLSEALEKLVIETPGS